MRLAIASHEYVASRISWPRVTSCCRELVVGEHALDAVGERTGVSRFEEQRRAGAANELGETPGVGDDQWRTTGQRFQRNDAERLVERGDHDHAGAVDDRPQFVVGQIAGYLDQIADPGDVDLRLELGQVGTAPDDHALQPGHAGPQRRHRPGEHVEPLLVLHASPGEHELGPGRVRRFARDAGGPPCGIDAVRDAAHVLGVHLEAGDDLADHQARAGNHPP